LSPVASSPVPQLTVASFNAHAGVDGWGTPFDLSECARSLDADLLVLAEQFWEDGQDGSDGEVPGLLTAGGYVEVGALRSARGLLLPPPTRRTAAWGPGPLTRTSAGLRVFEASRRPRGRRLEGAAVDGTAGRARPGRTGWWGMSLQSRLPCLDSWTIDLGKLARDSVRRGAVVVRLGLEGGEVTIVGTHLSHFTQGSPVQFRLLARALGRLDGPLVLAGDFNLFGPLVVSLLPGFRRAVRGRSWPSRWPLAQLDHVLYRGGLTVISSDVFPAMGSDHRAVRARLSWSGGSDRKGG